MTDAKNDNQNRVTRAQEGKGELGFDEIDTDRIAGKSLIQVDYERFAHFLEESDASDEEKLEFVQTVRNIVFSIASLGFKSHPVQAVEKICGKRDFTAAATVKTPRKMVR